MDFILNLDHHSIFYGFLITFVIPIFIIEAIILLVRFFNNLNTRLTKIEESILEFDVDIKQIYNQVANLEEFMMDYRQQHSHSYY